MKLVLNLSQYRKKINDAILIDTIAKIRSSN